MPIRYITDTKGISHWITSTSGRLGGGFTEWHCSCGDSGRVPYSSMGETYTLTDWKKHIDTSDAHTIVSDGEVGPKTALALKYKDSDIKDILFEVLLRLDRIEKGLFG